MRKGKLNCVGTRGGLQGRSPPLVFIAVAGHLLLLQVTWMLVSRAESESLPTEELNRLNSSEVVRSPSLSLSPSQGFRAEIVASGRLPSVALEGFSAGLIQKAFPRGSFIVWDGRPL